MKNCTWKRLFTLVILVALALIGTGCAPSKSAVAESKGAVSSPAAQGSKRGHFFYIAADYSGSIAGDDDLLHQYLGVIGQLCEHRAKYGDRYRLDFFANDVHPRTLDSPLPWFDSDEFVQLVDAATKDLQAGSTDRGTFFEKPFRQVIQIAKARPYDDIIAILLTDGLVDDAEASTKASREMSALSNLQYVIVGPVTNRPDFSGKDATHTDSGLWSSLADRVKIYKAMDINTEIPALLDGLGGEEL